MTFNHYELIKVIRGGEVKILAPVFKIRHPQWCKGQCRRRWDKVDLVNGFCWACEPKGDEVELS
jgi:hypothetical protein